MKIKIILLTVLLSGCANLPKEKWSGFVYANNDSMISIPQTNSLEDCRTAALKVIERKANKLTAKYNCKLNCSYIADILPYCQLTKKYTVTLK